ncbi:hypothetical protein SADUNF_Sadunf01G0183200 [Salix dunnii]|uniref:Uncharacterized protein n=1 Tax=Salix dunnii TaxID=1413687 RepID=A0A835ND36_9ROSI|nr:hypothetical protein SADUNF_Sadunf01G0183200 [Salix dunnii]
METTGKGEISAITVPESSWLEQLRGGCDADSNIQKVLQELRSGTLSSKHFEERNGYLFYKGRLTIPAANGLREQIVMDEHQRSNGIPVIRCTLQSVYAQRDDEKLEF